MEHGWTYEGKHISLSADPQLRERFRSAMRAKLEREHGAAPPAEEVEKMAALAWFTRAKALCAKADLLHEEGVSAEEVRRLVKVEPFPPPA